jgi:hypothetical protein
VHYCNRPTWYHVISAWLVNSCKLGISFLLTLRSVTLQFTTKHVLAVTWCPQETNPEYWKCFSLCCIPRDNSWRIQNPCLYLLEVVQIVKSYLNFWCYSWPQYQFLCTNYTLTHEADKLITLFLHNFHYGKRVKCVSHYL